MDIHENVSLAEFTTLRLGGPARFFVSVHSLEELREALAYAHTHTLPIFILGGGSNTLFSDDGWKGIVIRIALTGRDYTEDTRGDAQVIAGAGESWDDLVRDMVKEGFWGMENLSFVPGTVGATSVQNVGCYGVSASDIIDWVEVLDTRTNDLHILSNADCMFGYRDSVFKHSEGRHYIVTRVAYRLSMHATPKLAYKDLALYFEGRDVVGASEVREALRDIRGRKFPDIFTVGTAGSFFKNPIIQRAHAIQLATLFGEEVPQYVVDETQVKIPAAWILDKFGWKGKRVGQVGCWEAQPLVLVHYGGGTATELILFAYDIVRDVQQRASIRLEPEVQVVGVSHGEGKRRTQDTITPVS
ncbi:MAG: UDP-N-acetylmuramate dehydrogenase [Candidatus Pacebacteria bacterium]|nr:UDP-N-acetylmuramate dehydrogenase [Candidatus Paceibacterota bacterium]